MANPEVAWSLLRHTYNTNGIVLALGAGVPQGAGTPNWVELLMRIEDDLRGQPGTCLVRWFQDKGYSLAYIAAALEGMYPDTSFAEIVRAALYRDFPYYYRNLGKDFDKTDHAAFVEWMEDRSCTLCAVAALCAIRNGATGEFERNPSVHAVVDFNVDSILREFVEAKYGKRLLRTIERASKNPSLKRIALYKMHGLLRFESQSKQHPRKEAPDKLVFTEGEYFDRFNSPTSQFNYTFLSLLREHSVLFIGLSMQDDNIRRLLHYSTQERKRALEDECRQAIAQKREDTGGDAVPVAAAYRDIDRMVLRHFAVLRREETPGVDDIRETILRKLGVWVLWVDHHGQTLPRLGGMYETPERRWADVYGCKPKPRADPANIAPATNAALE
jgi:hypothetical protein